MNKSLVLAAIIAAAALAACGKKAEAPAPAPAAAAETSAALPAGWFESPRDADGNSYYYDAAGTTSWERPTEPAAGAVGAQPALPDGWHEALAEGSDGSAGSVYYFHIGIGEVRWERPT